MVHKEPLLVQASDLEVVDSSGYPLALHPYSAKLYSHQGTVNFSSKKNGPASWKRKTKKAKVDLSTTTVALYLLRYNMALQIAATAIVINLLLSVATFYFGLNSLYCAFGMDCVIGKFFALILVCLLTEFVYLSRHNHLVHSRLALCLRQDETHQGGDGRRSTFAPT